MLGNQPPLFLGDTPNKQRTQPPRRAERYRGKYRGFGGSVGWVITDHRVQSEHSQVVIFIHNLRLLATLLPPAILIPVIVLVRFIRERSFLDVTLRPGTVGWGNADA